MPVLNFTPPCCPAQLGENAVVQLEAVTAAVEVVDFAHVGALICASNTNLSCYVSVTPESLSLPTYEL